MTPHDSLRIAHVSDPHLTTLNGVGVGELCNKRILGYLSWLWRRRGEHRAEILSLVMADVAAHRPDHLIVTGDLTHVGTPHECQQARHWLDTVSAQVPVTLIPGNHDSYVTMPWPETLGLWTAFMQGDDAASTDAGSALFPALRRRGPVALIGLTSAVPSAPFCATGTLGAAQLDALRRMLAQTGAEGLFRLVIVHHPPAPHPWDWRRSLTDAHALQKVLLETGAELVIHGHGHCWMESSVPGPADAIPALGTPSASALSARPGRRAGYSIMEITTIAEGWRVDVNRYGLDERAENIHALGSTSFTRHRVSARAPATAGQ